MTRNKFTIAGLLIVIVVVIITMHQSQKIANAPSTSAIPEISTSKTLSILDTSRITKKPFGIYITPKNSPVQPEKFTGYHTGADFETTPAEANEAIDVPAICNGKLILKKYASGYGGVVVQSCNRNGQAVTVIYGHLQLASIDQLVGQVINEGNTIGVLGKGYSTETDGERKHLHLAIHKGSAINILGYVQKKSDLSAWFDPATILK